MSSLENPTSRLNLENLKKQAKRLVRWHRAGVHSVGPILRRVFPEWASMSDIEILSMRFSLSDAQKVIAHDHGFSDWAALKETICCAEDSMTTKSTNTNDRVRIIAAYPQLFVSDLRASCRYFENALGFKTSFVHGDPPFYGQVERDQVRLNLRCAVPPPLDPVRATREELLAAYLMVANVKPLYLEMKERGAVIHQPLRRAPWNMDEFVVTDIDGNLLLFASDPSES